MSIQSLARADPGVLNIEVPRAFLPLLKPARYKGAHGGRGGAKCLALGTLVLMADGTHRAAEEIRAGEQVMGPDGQPRNVLSTALGTGPLYRVQQKGSPAYVVNANHILAFRRTRDDGRYGSQHRNVPVAEYLGWSKRMKENFFGWKCNSLPLPQKQLPIPPYILGLWLGDGDTARQALTGIDDELFDEWGRWGESLGCRLVFRATGSAARIGILTNVQGQANPAKDALRALGVLNNKHIPEIYALSTERDRLELLAGLIDTDGSRHNNCLVFTQKSRRIAEMALRIADTLGFRTNLRIALIKVNGEPRPYYKLTISGACDRIPVRLVRKKCTPTPNKDHLIGAVSVEPIGEGEFAGFELDGDHLFCLASGIVTHNSHFFAEQLIKRAFLRPIRWVCIREVQNSLRDSVRQLLIDKIAKFGLEAEFDVLDAEIRGKNGALIIFRGMQHYNAETIKSLEGFDGAWVEEAQTFSETSLRMLRPTIREDGSEIWFSWNPRTKRDAVDAFLRGQRPEGSIVVKVGWQDNPWFPDVLRKEKDHDMEADPLTAAHVWGGEYQVLTKGSYYGALLAKARMDGRITRVPHESKLPVCTSWDLGMDGCIWFFQHVGMERRVIDFYQKEGAGLDHFAANVKNRDWTYEAHYLPHDIETPEISKGRGKSVRMDTLRAAQIGSIRVVQSGPGVVNEGIETVRSMLPQCWFDAEKCEAGIEAMQQYEAEWVEEHGVFKKQPLHNWASHPSDAFRIYAMGHRPTAKTKAPKDYPPPPGIA